METRRTILKYLAGSAGLATSSLSGVEAFARQLSGDFEKPNILCIVGEGLRWDELSTDGQQDHIHTEHGPD
jgi:hypothetical protein